MVPEKGIYLEFVTVLPLADTDKDHSTLYHAYLVYRDGKGGEEVIRGGPAKRLGAKGDPIEVQLGQLSASKDQYEPGDTMQSRHSVKLNLQGRPPEKVWGDMYRRAEEIGDAEIHYNLNPHRGGEDMQNSNSVVRAALEAGQVDAYRALPTWINPDTNIPGFQNDLSNPDSATMAEDIWEEMKALGETVPETGQMNRQPGDAGRGTSGREPATRAAPTSSGGGQMGRGSGDAGRGQSGLEPDAPVPRTGQMNRRPGDAGRGTSGLDNSTGGTTEPSGAGQMGRVSRMDVPGQGAHPATTDATPVAPMRPDAVALIREAETPLTPAREILMKDIRNRTEAETRTVMADSIYHRLDQPEHRPVQDLVRTWFEYHHGDRPHRNGFPAAGPDDFAIQPPTQWVPASATDGRSLADALTATAKGLVVRAAGGPVAEPVKDLQVGLSLMGPAIDGKTATVSLEEDGIFGPKTKEKTATMLAKAGSAQVREAEAFGGLARGLRKTATGGGETLAALSKRTLSPLYETPKQEEPATAPKPWNASVQRAITQSGGGALREDGVLGPKTEVAAWNALRLTGPDDLAWNIARETGLA